MNTRSHPEQPSVGLSATRARASYSYSQTYHAAFSTQLKPVHVYPLHHAPSPGNLDGKNSISFLHVVFYRVCVYCSTYGTGLPAAPAAITYIVSRALGVSVGQSYFDRTR